MTRKKSISGPSKGTQDADLHSIRAQRTRYQYKPLDPAKNEIRLLQILPGAGAYGGKFEVIRCSLFVTSLDSKQEYEALSYAWGDPTNREEILLLNQPCQVTRNLKAALRQLRSYSEANECKVYWIDALCINQEDDRERSEQVSRMRMIYEKAAQVLVWLGNGSQATPQTFSWLEELYQHRNVEKDVTVTFRRRSRTNLLAELMILLTNPYWNRIWIIQEVHSAKEITIMCGRSTITGSR